MSTRAQIVELLRAGYSDRAIARQVHVRNTAVGRIRTQLGLPKHNPGPSPAGSAEDQFWRRAQHTDDGHLLWPAYTPGRAARVRYSGVQMSVHRIAFGIAHDREPVGKVRSGYKITGCVHPRHVEDQPMRDKYRAIFQGAAA
ncbi:hypothetical protein ABT119_06270 [Streptomyces sp. NPDC001910]|uniref:hypothetical protein n=1 Tax=Streptomyces sp. NPDC001910 TaxID=3154403 RepID=UPI003319AF67